MEMFTLYKEKLKIADDAYIPPSLSKIFDKVDDDEKIKWALYVFLQADRTDDNPIKDIPEFDRPQRAKSMAFGVKTLDQELKKLAHKAIKEYQKDQFDEAQADIDLYDKKMTQFMQLLKDTEPVIIKNINESTGAVSYTTNIDIITAVLENIIKIIVDKNIVVGLKTSGNSVTMLRGGLSPNSKGKFTKKSKAK